MSAKDEIIRLITQLRPEDVPEVKAALSLVAAAKSAPRMAEDISSDWLLFGIVRYLSRRGLMVEQESMLEMSRRTAYKTYREKKPPVMQYLTRIERQLDTHSKHRPTLALICAIALAEFLEHRAVFGVSAMLSQIDKIPEALERAYPGYINAGLLRFVLSSLDPGDLVDQLDLTLPKGPRR